MCYFYQESEKNTPTEKSFVDHRQRLLSPFFFENIALESKTNRKIVSVHNNTRNQSLEGRANLFIGTGSTSKLSFPPVDNATLLASTFVNENDRFSFILSSINYSVDVSQKWTKASRSHEVRFPTRYEGHYFISFFFPLYALLSRLVCDFL
jgi:hypothetical protein